MHRSAKPIYAGLIPARASNFGRGLAQLAEHRILIPNVAGSTPASPAHNNKMRRLCPS